MVKHAVAAVIAAAVLFLGAVGHAEDDGNSIQFGPPPFPMTNLVVNDAQDIFSVDYMNFQIPDMFSFDIANFGFGMMNRSFDQGGWSLGFAMQGVFGSMNYPNPISGDTIDVGLYGMGFYIPFNFFYDGLSKEADDASLPVYFGLHVGMNNMSGSFSYTYQVPYIYGWPPKIGYMTYYEYISMSMSMINIGWQAGIQYGLNLGPYIKVIPYIDFMQDVIANSTMSMSGIYMDSTTQSYSLGPMPVAVMPGFDIVLRRLGLSLGGAYQSVKQESGANTKTTNIHLRFTRKFRSICGL